MDNRSNQSQLNYNHQQNQHYEPTVGGDHCNLSQHLPQYSNVGSEFYNQAMKHSNGQFPSEYLEHLTQNLAKKYVELKQWEAYLIQRERNMESGNRNDNRDSNRDRNDNRDSNRDRNDNRDSNRDNNHYNSRKYENDHRDYQTKSYRDNYDNRKSFYNKNNSDQDYNRRDYNRRDYNVNNSNNYRNNKFNDKHKVYPVKENQYSGYRKSDYNRSSRHHNHHKKYNNSVVDDKPLASCEEKTGQELSKKNNSVDDNNNNNNAISHPTNHPTHPTDQSPSEETSTDNVPKDENFALKQKSYAETVLSKYAAVQNPVISMEDEDEQEQNE